MSDLEIPAGARAVPLHGIYAIGRVALLDEADYELVSGHRWRAFQYVRPSGSINGPYALCEVIRGGKRSSLRMHNLVMGQVGIDHINHDGLDNRRSNLRPATDVQSLANTRKRPGLTSRYKGVCQAPACRRRPWLAQIFIDGKNRNLGSFSDEESAARARDAAAIAAWGEYAWLNFPPDGRESSAA